ncbi:MAG: DUF1631 family protein, partial [Caldimonas sp.]
MNPIEPRVQAALDAAMNQIRTAAASAAMRVAEVLDLQAQNATKPAERELIFNALQELRRNMGMFQGAFHEALREKVAKDLTPHIDNKRKLESADWQTLSLVDVEEVEERMNYVRLGQLISHECEWQLRDLAAYMGALLGLGRADEERNPLRAEVIGAALNRGIEAISGDRDNRRIYTRELGQAVAQTMPECYAEILKMLQTRGVQPVHLTVRTVEGPGNQLHNANSGYMSMPRDGRISTRGGYGDFDEPSGSGDMDLLAAHRRALATAFPGQAPPPDSVRDAAPAPRGGTGRGAAPHVRLNAAADQQLMTLLRRLTAVPSRPGELGPAALIGGNGGGGYSGGPSARGDGGGYPGPAGYPGGYPGTGYGTGGLPPGGAGYAGGGPGLDPGNAGGRAGLGGESSRGAPITGGGGGGGGGTQYNDGLTGMMAVNLIRAHRDELIQASTGKLDHMVIDVVGSLFDQILSDSRVPPQMAREI